MAQPDAGTTYRGHVVPTLGSLALDVVAVNVHQYEPHVLTLPYGGGVRLCDRLISSSRLRPETLQPLLTDWSCAGELESRLGAQLTAAASACRGLSALAVQRLQGQQAMRRDAQIQRGFLPEGTRSSRGATTDTATAAR